MDWSPILISIRTACVSILFTFFLGLFAAWWVARMRSNKWKMIMDGLFTLPLVLPPTVLGFFLLYIFGVQRPVGKFLLDFFSVKVVFSWSATVIAAVTASFPLMYRSARGALEQVEDTYLQAARTLGYSEWKVFWCIWMPLALPGVASGAVLSFARGLGEFGATAMIAGNIAGKTRTLPLKIYSEVAAGNMSGAYTYVMIVVVISFVTILAMNYFTLRGQRYAKRGGRT
ncbi:molybdate ABC transporter permease subunit [Diplocloster hominis]|uniref:molybdate ABC transporter permease subunit n=1 Tax=Diplocloster hominis TaxID=3079010 RepID=UPI0031BA2DC1